VDDNTLSYGHPDLNVLTSVLESESNVLINWFKVNKMQANPDKFQVLAVGKKTFDKNKKVSLIKTLKNRGPKIDPWGTPFWMSDQLLRTLLILICCFLFDK
jgi:hypothetical protein